MKASLCVLLQLFELDPDLLRSKPEPQDQSLHARFGEIKLRRRVDLALFRVLDRAFGGFGSGSIYQLLRSFRVSSLARYVAAVEDGKAAEDRGLLYGYL